LSHLPDLIIILGPTGSGKSTLALDIAERFGGEIVNCDSVQLYRDLNIGAAKTPPEDRRGIPHHLIDLLEPSEHYTAGDYARAARAVVSDIAGRGRIPVMAGGTGFYVRAFLEGLSESPERDPELRSRLAGRTGAVLHRWLRRLDPAAAARIHANDRNKLIRAIEVCVRSRRPMTELFAESPIQKLEGFRVRKVGLDPDRVQLADRLNARCVRMFEAGLVEEVRGILSRGVPRDAKALLSIGYREALQYLDGALSAEEALERMQAATRQYAKRQRTWFRKEPYVWWIPQFGDAEKALDAAIHHLQVGIK
jgi:tRNA dimethylallyltransferase